MVLAARAAGAGDSLCWVRHDFRLGVRGRERIAEELFSGVAHLVLVLDHCRGRFDVPGIIARHLATASAFETLRDNSTASKMRGILLMAEVHLIDFEP